MRVFHRIKSWLMLARVTGGWLAAAAVSLELAAAVAFTRGEARVFGMGEELMKQWLLASSAEDQTSSLGFGGFDVL